MKRKIALLVFVILILCLALTACNQTAATKVLIRWKTETHVFNISLADFAGDSNNFKYYTSEGVAVEGGKYQKDIAFASEFKNWDEIRPLAVSGTYTIDVVPSSDGTAYCDVTTKQEMCVAYKEADIHDNSELLAAKATQEQMDKCKMTDTFDSNVVILYSATETAVRFENTSSQKPLSSSVKVDGFYTGKAAQKLTKYEISTEYDYSGKRPVAKTIMKTADGENTTEYKFARNSAGTFIDSNQILIYMRSLDKSSTSFQDNPSKNVFNPYTQTLQVASFGMSYEYDVLLTDTAQDKTLATNINVVSAAIGNNPFIMQENLPEGLAKKNLDVFSTLSGNESKFTTVRFRVGYLAYEIDYSDTTTNTTNWSEIWTALATPAEEKA
ncbi:MAG: hypothetical protein J1G02_01870 [Clostridiales bacterium]|nr:hypothetical protein [Clostridiales bacterium]